MSEEFLSITIDGVKLIMSFNPNRKKPVKKEGQKKNRPKLKEFYKAVGSEDEYRERSFFQ